MNTRLKTLLLFAIFSFSLTNIYSQNSHPKFGVINQRDLDIEACDFEKEASAIYLFEYGESEIVYYREDGGYYVKSKYHARIKVLTDEGIKQGDFEFPMYRNSRDHEEFTEIEAITYNQLDDGSVEKTKLKESQIFREDISESKYLYKFAMPKVKKGSIIEIKYEKLSPYLFNFEPWLFQANIPKLKSEFTSIITGNFNYNLELKGNLKLTSRKGELLKKYLRVGSGSADASKYIYTMVNVPSFKKERYVTTSKNYISMIKYELKTYHSFRGVETNYAKTWRDIDRLLLDDDRFGDQFDVKILKDEIKTLTKTYTDTLELSKSIFNLVKEKIVFNGDYRLYASKGGLKTVLKKGSGNSADVNLTLLNALLRAGIDADAVALSTRSNGFINRKYPVISEFNYVIVEVKIGGNKYLLDATRKNVPFGLLPFECYNIRGRVVKKKGDWTNLETGDRFYKNSTVSINLKDDLSFSADVTRMYGMQSAIEFRNTLDKYNSIEDYIEDKEEKGDLLYDDYTVENRNKIDKGTIVKEKFKLEDNIEGVVKENRILFNPIIIGRISKNPFKLDQRTYPVDYGLPTSIKTSYSINIPDGYELAKKYKPVKLTLPSNMGYYVYSLREGPSGNILLTTFFVINRSVISAQNYKSLKNFYNSVINKNNTLIELKKIDLTAEKN